ncbi:restriction endonuclease [Spirosoma pollinicola]|uniref:Restriction endonuclease n=2 Tax=Spirosoma pollinicola TaxID=2057025 RepID=A0A2K8ZBM6_9BACT|nr:restriction endonuclease [Spirosoma pollinicola]
MVHARSNGQEIHLFFRAIHHTNFIYFGRIEVIDVEVKAKYPSKFIFHLNEYYSDVTYNTVSEQWNRAQLLSVFNLYLKLPPGELNLTNEEIKKLAKLIGKSESSVAMKLNNFAFTDPYNKQNGIIGLEEGAGQVKPIWDEFLSNQEDLTYESERKLSEYQDKRIEESDSDVDFQVSDLKGDYIVRNVKTRINQNVFRKMILKTYASKCAISGINTPELLVAGHIIPWAENEKERLNPQNGICLSNLYDRAYEKGLICIDTDYKVLISRRLKATSHKEFYNDFFGRFEYKPIHLPRSYQPKKEFLEYRLNLFDR